MMDGSRDEAGLRAAGGLMAERFRQGLGIDSAHRVLEIGCGLGRVARELAPRVAAYDGVDHARSLLRHARRRCAGVACAAGRPGPRFLAPDEVEGDYDRVLCHLVLLHCDAAGRQALLGLMASRLSPEGLGYFDAWNAAHPEAAALRAREAADPRLARQPHRARFHGRAELEDWLGAAGLAAVWTSDASFLLQAVVMRAGAQQAVRRAAAERLAGTAEALVPRGRLTFA